MSKKRESGFAYDFNTLYDMVESRSDWRIHIKLAEGRYWLKAMLGKDGVKCESVPVYGSNFDQAASALAPKLSGRGILP